MVIPPGFAYHRWSSRWCRRWSSSASRCAAGPPPAGWGRAGAPCRCTGNAARSDRRCLKCSPASRGSRELSFLTLGKGWCYKAGIPERKRSLETWSSNGPLNTPQKRSKQTKTQPLKKVSSDTLSTFPVALIIN